MKKFIIFSRDFHVMPIADRLVDDGCEVVFAHVDAEKKLSPAKEKMRCSLYDNILEKHDADDVLSWMKTVNDKDEWFVFFDYGDLFPFAEKALKLGFTKGIFPTEEDYELEHDRTAGKTFAKLHYPDLVVAEAKEFKSIEDAIEFLEEQKDKIFVLKSEGSDAETVVPQTDDADLARSQIIGALITEQKDYERGGFTLEERIVNPIELSPVMVFWDGKPLFSLVELENKPIGSGNIGRLTGGCQNLTIATPMGCALNKIAFPEVVYDMAKSKKGMTIFDAGLLFDGKQFRFTEFCAQRYGFDGFYSTVAMCGDSKGKDNAVNFFTGIAAGKNPVRNEYGVCVRLFQTQPGDEGDTYDAGYFIDWKDEVSDQLFLYCIEGKDMKKEGKPVPAFVSNGFEKEIGTCTGTAQTFGEAIDNAYRCADAVAMTGLYYRPKLDFKSKAYFTSILNRLDFLGESGLIEA